MKLDDLIARLEAAPEGSRELGDEVLIACGWEKRSVGYFLGPIYHWRSPEGESLPEERRPNPTTSLDAAMTLVPRHGNGDLYCTLLECYSDGSGNCCIIPPVGDKIWSRVLATPALATCAAALRARGET